MKELYKITLSLLVFFMSTAAFGQFNLLIVNNPSKRADSLLINYLTPEGYNVTFVPKSEFLVSGGPFSTAEGYAAYDAVYFGESLGSNDVFNFHVAGYPIPCVLTEGWVFKAGASKWNWLDDEANQFLQFGSADPVVTHTIVFNGDKTTWLGRQYEEGAKLVWTTKESATGGCGGVALDEVIPDAIPIGNLVDDLLVGKSIFWAIPEGSTITTDPNSAFGGPVEHTLPNMVYLGVISAGQDLASDEYLGLMLNCIKWVTGNYEKETSVNALNNKCTVYPNPTSGIVNVSFSSNISGIANVTIYNLAGTLVKTINRSALVSSLCFDMSGLSNGQYLYRITTEKEVLRGKICKR